MEVNEFVELFKEALSNPDVIETLKAVLCSKALDCGGENESEPGDALAQETSKTLILTAELEAERGKNRELAIALEQSRSELEACKAEVVRLKKESKDAENDTQRVELLLQSHTKELNQYKDQFKSFIAAYSSFMQLSHQEQAILHGIIVPEPFESFVCCICKEDVMRSLYEYVKRIVINGGDSAPDALLVLFKHSFHLCNLAYEEPVYEMLDTVTGAPFDEDFHISLSKGLTKGVVERVLLDGYKNRQGIVIQKSLVRCR